MGVLKSTTAQGSWQETARGKLRSVLQTGSALTVVLALTACSSVPDAINPIEWGKSVGDMFDGEDEEAAVKSDEAIPGEDGEYPSLANTPAKPVVTGDQERDALIAGLAADRQNAQYTQGGRRQSSPPVNALQSAPQVPVSEPVIAPAPTTPVSSSAMADAGSTAATAAAASATTSAVTSAPSGSRIADEWNAQSPASGPVPTPEAAPAAPTAIAAAGGVAAASSGDPVMDQYQRRLAEGQGVFANEPAPMPSSQDFDYSLYSDDGSVVVDESQFGGSTPVYGDSGMVSMDMTATNNALASRLGVRSIDQVGPGINETQIAQIQFGHGSTNLGGADYRVLDQVAATWQQTSGFIRVIGHASMRTGNMSLEQHLAVNRRVSEGRASAVVSRLLSLGVSPDAIFVGADGSAVPRYYEGVPAGEAGNRRVEIYLDY
jgi:outer membrane protein OmpA-like peptidoglycan-associated protein